MQRANISKESRKQYRGRQLHDNPGMTTRAGRFRGHGAYRRGRFSAKNSPASFEKCTVFIDIMARSTFPSLESISRNNEKRSGVGICSSTTEYALNVEDEGSSSRRKRSTLSSRLATEGDLPLTFSRSDRNSWMPLSLVPFQEDGGREDRPRATLNIASLARRLDIEAGCRA